MELTRWDFMEMVADCFDEFSCMMYFGVSRDLLASHKAVWNQDLEIAYNNYVSEREEEA